MARKLTYCAYLVRGTQEGLRIETDVSLPLSQSESSSNEEVALHRIRDAMSHLRHLAQPHSGLPTTVRQHKAGFDSNWRLSMMLTLTDCGFLNFVPVFLRGNIPFGPALRREFPAILISEDRILKKTNGESLPISFSVIPFISATPELIHPALLPRLLSSDRIKIVTS